MRYNKQRFIGIYEFNNKKGTAEQSLFYSLENEGYNFEQKILYTHCTVKNIIHYIRLSYL